MAKTKGKWGYVKKQHEAVWKVMKGILESEPYDDTLSDEKLADAVKAQGCYCTPTIAREVRTANGVGNSEERKFTQFAKQYAASKK